MFVWWGVDPEGHGCGRRTMEQMNGNSACERTGYFQLAVSSVRERERERERERGRESEREREREKEGGGVIESREQKASA